MDEMIQISLKDNQSFNKAYSFIEEDERDKKKIPEEYWGGMRGVCDINKLIKRHKIITLPDRSYYRNKEVFERVNDRLYTYNWVGVISNNTEDGKHYRIEITSRFDEGNRQHFLLYLLCNVIGVNVFDLSINSETESDYTVILVLLFLKKLTDASADGLYKEYVRNEYNDYNFRGAFDIKRHLLQNNPFIGKTAYLVREYSYDNNILCLIRQTMDYIMDYYPNVWKGYCLNAVDLKEFIDVIETATPSYRMNVNYADSRSCQKEITNPLFHNFEEARKLALMILRENGQNVFFDDEEDTVSLLIDISWLWEEFIFNRLLEDKGYKHLLNKSNDKARECLEWADGEKWYPDFIEDKEISDRRGILDAKYKDWEWAKDDDVHQLLSYLYLTGGQTGGFIFPVQSKEKSKFDSMKLKAYKTFYDREKPAILYKMPFLIPVSDDSRSFEKYSEIMEEHIKKWKEEFDKT